MKQRTTAGWRSRAASPRRRLFFFQAEDGIRGIGVTGVQTCALPICIVLLLIYVGKQKQYDAYKRAFAAQQTGQPATQQEIGRASCRERVEIWEVDAACKRMNGMAARTGSGEREREDSDGAKNHIRRE